MGSRKSIWFHIGHALERARDAGAPSGRRVMALAERRGRSVDAGGGRRKPEADETRTRIGGPRPPIPSADDLIAAGVAMVVDRALAGWGKRRKPGFTGLVRAGAAGATAALVVDLIRPLVDKRAVPPTFDRTTAERLLTGFSQGLVYGAVVEPRLPGPALLKGVAYGSVEYAADPAGGLAGVLGSHAPQGRLPVLGDALNGLDGHDRDYVEHVVFGIVLAMIYESSASRSGILPDEE